MLILFPRVIQMIDENKEQLRNLFRNYNVLDVQPAITARAPDDLSALQVRVGYDPLCHKLSFVPELVLFWRFPTIVL